MGYSVGILAGLIRGPLLRVFKKPSNIILFGSAFYMLACVTLAVPNLWVLFGGLWGVAFGEFLVHANCPGIINHIAVTGGFDRSMVNGLFSVLLLFGRPGRLLRARPHLHAVWMDGLLRSP